MTSRFRNFTFQHFHIARHNYTVVYVNTHTQLSILIINYQPVKDYNIPIPRNKLNTG